ncbi:MAG: SDR family NAD(P)-dependent oxidoreductase [Pseudonocardiaceae bacterium]
MTHAACVKLVTPALTACGYGCIVAVSSVLTQVGLVNLAGYIAAKSGLEGLIRALARELGAHGVTVNCVRPGSIEVPAEHAVVSDHAHRAPWCSISTSPPAAPSKLSCRT